MAVLAACLCVVPGSLETQAQGRRGHAEGRMPLGGPVVPAAEDADRAHNERAELTAQRLLAIARKDLAENRPEIAQRVLEVLIARFPEAPAAGDARRELFKLYARTEANGRVTQPAPAPRFAAGRAEANTATATSAVTAPSARTTAGEPPVAAWRTTVVSHRRLQDELRNSVGDRVFFSAGSAELGSRARAVLAAQAEWVLRRPEIDVVVEGHADDAMVGADDETLADGRAGAVRDRLIAEGVPPERIRVETRGARDPVAICGDDACAGQNRRVVVRAALRQATGTGNSAALPTAPAGRGDSQR